jgi:hypothetical protein
LIEVDHRGLKGRPRFAYSPFAGDLSGRFLVAMFTEA